MTDMETSRAEELQNAPSESVQPFREIEKRGILGRTLSLSMAKHWTVALMFAAMALAQPAPEQPLPYSHKLHAGSLKLKCTGCHVNKDPGDAMGFPAVATCMACHSSIATNKPSIQKLAAAAKSGQDIAWVRVYKTPPFVWFSHRSHLNASTKCEDCHGPVAEREKISREGDISMGGCMACHRAKKVSIDCDYCHERP